MQYQSIKKKYVKPLERQDKDLEVLFQKYDHCLKKRRIRRILADRELASLKTQSDVPTAEKKLLKFLEEADKNEQELSREFVNAYQALEYAVRRNLFVKNPLHVNRLSSLTRMQGPKPDPFLGCEADSGPFDFPPFLPFCGLHTFDPGSLFFDIVAPEVGVQGAPGALIIPNVYITAWGKGKTAWISGSWCFKPPTHIDLCGFTLAGKLKVEGLIDNKSGSSVTVKMDAGITQYRVDKAWDEINPSMDIPYRNLRAMCYDQNNTLHPDGYTDGIYGLHSLTPLEAGIEFSFRNLGYGCDYQDGDTFFVGYWVEIRVGDESYIQFEHSNLGSIVMSRPTLVLYKPVS
ncbi:MAG: hypothetical protein ABII93_02300 [Chrysiogenia bacterium]